MQDQNASVQSDALKYAQFVKIAIEYHKSPNNVLNPTQDQYPEFPQGYTLWANIQMNDTSDPRTPIAAYYGFIAFNNTNLHDLVVAIRGTQTQAEWEIDAKSKLVAWDSEGPNAGQVEQGFVKLYNSLQLLKPGSNDVYDNDLGGLGESGKITMIGHSLGSSLVTLYGAHLAANITSNVTIYTLASPCVGDQDFVKYYQKAAPKTYRIYNVPDKVPQQLQKINDSYKHVSDGISVDSSKDPYKQLIVQHSDECAHSLYTYMFLLNANPTKTDMLDRKCRA